MKKPKKNRKIKNQEKKIGTKNTINDFVNYVKLPLIEKINTSCRQKCSMKPFKIIEDRNQKLFASHTSFGQFILRIISYKFVIVFFIWNGLEENLGNKRVLNPNIPVILDVLSFRPSHTLYPFSFCHLQSDSNP